MPQRPRQTRAAANEAIATNQLNLNTLRPGYLVSLKTSVKGNVSYDKTVIEADHKTRAGIQKAKWQTERTIQDPEEFAKAGQVRMKCRATIAAVCTVSNFGLLCLESRLPELQAAMTEARRLADVFNRRSRMTTVSVYIITGKIARDDVEAARAINSEVRELLKDMTEGLQNLDVAKVREAANKARNIGSMLQPEAAAKIKGAIDAARGAARKVVKAGENVAEAIDTEAIRAINSARTSFLDLGEAAPEVGTPTAEARAVDLEAAPEPTAGSRRPTTRRRVAAEAEA